MERLNEPRVGCGAAILQDNRILLLKRLTAPEAGHWGLPGGKIEWMETAEHAVCREVLEELGIRLRNLRLLCIVDQIDLCGNEHWIAPVYVSVTFDGCPRIVEPLKHGVLGWFRLDDLPAPLTAATLAARSVLAVTGTQNQRWANT